MRRFIVALALSLIGFNVDAADTAKDILIADFEGETYGDWKITGEAFGSGPAKGTLPGQMHVDGFKGKGLVNSFFKGDGSVGTLTSPAFKVERKYINFLIGGGKNIEKTCINLLVDGKIVRSATGPNDKAGGSETLSPDTWDVAEFAGKQATIQIVDNATGGWGHINVDHIVQSDRKAAQWVNNAERQLMVIGRYLMIPIKNGAAKRKVTFLSEGKTIVSNDIELADEQPDWWAITDLSKFNGKKITIRVDRLIEDSKALTQLKFSSSIPDLAKTYQAPYRPQLHFSSQRGWINDPNGLVYYDGLYHLFYQHNPYGREWGNMHWGHAVSPDMIHWTEQSDVLAPDELGPMFSGSAVVDWKNTSGLGKDGKPPIVLIYTAAGDPTTQCIAYSVDQYRFTKYEKNPVIKQVTPGNRDPKVFWYEPTKKWVMVLYVELKGKHTVHFYNSPNLIDWNLASITENNTGKNNYLFECPDFFPLPVDGDPKNVKWVLMAANSEYAIGKFDGEKFTPEHSKLPGHRGQGFYAAQTFSDIPEKDGRRIQIGWFQTPAPGMPFNQSMTLPFELKLTSTSDGPRLSWKPVRETKELRKSTLSIGKFELTPTSKNPMESVKEDLLELDTEFSPDRASEVTFTLRGAKVVYDSNKQELNVHGHRVSVPAKKGKISLHVFVDRTSMELFVNDGSIYIPMPFLPKPDDRQFSVQVKAGNVSFQKFDVYRLDTSWK